MDKQTQVAPIGMSSSHKYTAVYMRLALAAVVPVVIVVYAVTIVWSWANSAATSVLLLLPITPDPSSPIQIFLYTVIPPMVMLMGFFASMMAVGYLLTWGLVARIVNRVKEWGESVPLFGKIYAIANDVAEIYQHSSNGQLLGKPVLVPSPFGPSWTYGFMMPETTEGSEPKFCEDPNQFVRVYVITAPNPTSGYVILIRLSDCRQVESDFSSVLELNVSMGLVEPEACRADRESLTRGE